jgi:hypothetical protein
MGYIFFGDDKVPTPEESGTHFAAVLSNYWDSEECHVLFYNQVLKPFHKARDAYRERVPGDLPWNPFVGGMFFEVNGVSVWKALIASDKRSHKILLAILHSWGFSEANEFGWTNDDQLHLIEMFDNDDEFFAVFQEAYKLDA